MPEYISGRPFMVKVLFENLLEDAGVIKLIHDGGKTGALRYTREYRIYVKGEKTDSIVKFTYNKREDWVDITMNYFSLMNLKFVELREGIRNEGIQVSEPEGDKQARAGDEKAGGGYGSPESKRFFESLKKSEGKPEQVK